jgi:hypothetical protein
MAALTTSFMAVRSAPTFTGSKVAARAVPAPVARRSVVVRAEEKAAAAPAEKAEEKPWAPPTLDPNTPSPIFGGSTGGLLRKAQVEEFYVLTWEAKKEAIFEMPVRYAPRRADPRSPHPLLSSATGAACRGDDVCRVQRLRGTRSTLFDSDRSIGLPMPLSLSANATRDLDRVIEHPTWWRGRASLAGSRGLTTDRIGCAYRAPSWRRHRPQVAPGRRTPWVLSDAARL